MLKRSDELKVALMDALKFGPKTAPEVMLLLDERLDDIALNHVVKALTDLEAEGFVKTDRSSSVMPIYSHAYEHALSDLRAKLLPHRDPVREGHEFEATRGQRYEARYRRPTRPPDHDSESG